MNGKLDYALTLDDAKFQAAGKRATTTVSGLKQSTETFTASARLAGTAAAAFGNQGLAIIATTAQMASYELKSVGMLMKGGGGGPYVLAAVAAVASLAAGWNLAKWAMKDYRAAEQSAADASESKHRRFMEMMDAIAEANKKGFISDTEAHNLGSSLLNLSPEAFNKQYLKVGRRLEAATPTDMQLSALEKLKLQQREYLTLTLEGSAREAMEAENRHNRRMAQINDELALVDKGSSLRKQAEAAADAARKESNAVFLKDLDAINAKQKVAPGVATPSFAMKQSMTSIEQIGFAFRGSFVPGQNEARQTADNTRRTAVAVEKLLNRPTSTGDFTNL